MSSSPSRLQWIDHLRTFTIILVVNMHACVTYSHVGDWYVTSAHEPALTAKIPYILWQAHLQSFSMGLLFFVSGYFAAGSMAHRGVRGFVRERLRRLGLPALLYMLVIHPFIVRGINPWNAEFPPVVTFYVRYLVSGRFMSGSGPLWFAVALLGFCLAFAGWRQLRPPGNAASPSVAPLAPQPGAIWLWATVLGLGSFLIRLIQPVGTNVLNLQLCYFVQYVAAFALGVTAAQRGWLQALASSRHARIAGWSALVLGPAVLLAILLVGMREPMEHFFGGWHWPAFGLAVWEQLAGMGLALGLLALFSTTMDRHAPVLRWMADRSFAVYVFHAPVLVTLFLLFRPLQLPVLGHIVLMTVAGLVGSFVVADLARRLPGLRTIL